MEVRKVLLLCHVSVLTTILWDLVLLLFILFCKALEGSDGVCHSKGLRQTCMSQEGQPPPELAREGPLHR